MTIEPSTVAMLDQTFAEYAHLLDEAVERMRTAIERGGNPELTIAHVAFAMADISDTHPAIRDMILTEHAVALYHLARQGIA